MIRFGSVFGAFYALIILTASLYMRYLSSSFSNLTVKTSRIRLLKHLFY